MRKPVDNNQPPTTLNEIALRQSDFYNAARRRLEHEDSLNVSRLSWLITSQSFLFSAFAVVVNGLGATHALAHSYKWYQDQLFRMIPMLGLFSCALIYVGVIGGVVAQRRLRKMVEANVADNSCPPPIAGLHTRWLGLFAPLFLPPAFILAWLILCRPLG